MFDFLPLSEKELQKAAKLLHPGPHEGSRAFAFVIGIMRETNAAVMVPNEEGDELKFQGTAPVRPIPMLYFFGGHPLLCQAMAEQLRGRAHLYERHCIDKGADMAQKQAHEFPSEKPGTWPPDFMGEAPGEKGGPDEPAS